MTCIAVKIGMKQSNIKIAVTGGIGSGKSTVCNLIAKLGYPVYSCDEIYAELFVSGAFLKEIIAEFGDKVAGVKGGVDRKKLAAEVFSDDGKLDRLNAITHPAIFSEMFRRAEERKGLVFFEVPVLFEGGYQKLFDEIIVVTRDMADRVECIKKRDGLSHTEIKERINKQYNYDLSDFTQYYVIHNDCDLSILRDIIGNLMLKITKKYSQ